MIHSREEHWLFLEEEYQAQLKEFQKKLDSSASDLLLNKGELFISQLLKFENGEMILKFSNGRSVPRKGEHLYCFTTPNNLHDYREWGNLTYGDLVKVHGYASEVSCVWQASFKEDPKYCMIGFRGVDSNFAEMVKNAKGVFLILGPNIPPFQYIKNLQRIVKDRHEDCVNRILDVDYSDIGVETIWLEDNIIPAKFIFSQLELSDNVMLQGPPGTGKTHQIANLCRLFCEQGKSVLVTALTNRALMEVAEKREFLDDLLKAGKVHKTVLSVDESHECPKIESAKEIVPVPGNVMLSTFYVASGKACNVDDNTPFDVVIMDEASQAFLAMFAATAILGKKNIWVGDTHQLPPVVCINEDRMAKQNYFDFVDGFKSLTSASVSPLYSLFNTFRLTPRAASYTGLFYENHLVSRNSAVDDFNCSSLDGLLPHLFNKQGGPSLFLTDLPNGDLNPLVAITATLKIISTLVAVNSDDKVAVLSFRVESVKGLQKSIYQIIGMRKNLIVDTVSRIQGLTADVVIYVIPHTGYFRSLDKRLFNVATSRARKQTIIIADKDIIKDAAFIDKDVRKYLERLKAEHSYYLSAANVRLLR